MDLKATRDPEASELYHFASATQIASRHVLEIGCGKGQLTGQYASLPAQLVAIDPDEDSLRVAREKKIDSACLHFARADGCSLPFPAGTFDLAFFASSL